MLPVGADNDMVSKLREDPIKRLLLFEEAIGVLTMCFSFYIFSFSGQQLFSEEEDLILHVHLSPCRKKVALGAFACAVEVSQRGTELRRTRHNNGFVRVRCITDGLLSWEDSGSSVIIREKEEERKLQFPELIRRVEYSDDSSFALFYNSDRLWIVDRRTGR